MASRLLRREICKRLVRHRTLVAAKKVNEQKNFISLLHQQILNNLKDSKIDNLYPIGNGLQIVRIFTRNPPEKGHSSYD